MRVLHVYSGNLFGGIESMLLACAGVPAEESGVRHDFALCFDERLASELRGMGQVVHLLGPVRLRRPVSAHAARMALGDLLRRERYDRVICHAPWSHAIFGGVVKRAGVPLAFWAHDRMMGRHWTERVARLIRPRLVVCNSHFTESSAGALFPGVPSAVVHPPVRPVRPLRERRHVRMSLATSADSVVVVQASRCQAWKGHRLVLEALAALRDLPGWTWWVAGGAQRPEEEAFLAALERAAVRADIDDRIRWLGQRSDVPTVLAAADIYCQANIEPEPFGVVFVEALSASVPVVAAAHGGATEIVQPSCGMLVPPGDPAALAVALRTLIEDGALRAALGNAGPSRAAELCDPKAQVTKLARALDLAESLELAG